MKKLLLFIVMLAAVINISAQRKERSVPSLVDGGDVVTELTDESYVKVHLLDNTSTYKAANLKSLLDTNLNDAITYDRLYDTIRMVSGGKIKFDTSNVVITHIPNNGISVTNAITITVHDSTPTTPGLGMLYVSPTDSTLHFYNGDELEQISL